MDFSKLYEMWTIGKRMALHVEAVDEIADSCALYAAQWRPSSPIVFRSKKGASGSRAYDLIGTTHVILKLISARVVSALAPFTGWTTYPVEVYGRKGELIPGYRGLAVTGRCGPIDNRRSQPRICPPPVPQGQPVRRWFGLYFDSATWDGSDVFVPEGTGLTVVTEAVKVALQHNKITNVEFCQLTEAENASSALLFSKR